MSRQPLTLRDYVQLGKDRGLEYGEKYAPNSVHTKVYWLCPHCNTQLHKSYHHLKYQQYPCRCVNGRALNIEDYHRLAEQLGITFVHPYVPHNIFEKVPWQLTNGNIIRVCYRDLKYTNYLQKLMEHLGDAVYS